jgi:hypothetical protein
MTAKVSDINVNNWKNILKEVTQRSGFDSRIYQIFWEVVGLKRGPLSLVSKIEELLDRKVAAAL